MYQSDKYQLAYGMEFSPQDRRKLAPATLDIDESALASAALGGSSSSAAGYRSSTSRVSITLTEMVSHQTCSSAARLLETNMALLRQAGSCSQSLPMQGVSALSIPPVLLSTTQVFIVGSPASHNPLNKRRSGMPQTSSVQFMQDVFHSMCWSHLRTVPW